MSNVPNLTEINLLRKYTQVKYTKPMLKNEDRKYFVSKNNMNELKSKCNKNYSFINLTGFSLFALNLFDRLSLFVEVLFDLISLCGWFLTFSYFRRFFCFSLYCFYIIFPNIFGSISCFHLN